MSVIRKLEDAGLVVASVPAATANYDSRGPRPTEAIDSIVIHVAQASMMSMDSYFAMPRPTNPTSAHFGVSKAGIVHVYVPTDYVAWHAGNAAVNATSIGIEHEGVGEDYSPTQMQLRASVTLASVLCREYGIPFDHIYPHRKFRATLCPVDFPMEKYKQLVESAVTGNAAPSGKDWKVVIHRDRERVQILDVPASHAIYQSVDPEKRKVQIDIRVRED